jgi:AraC-like DNA-binding protein
MGTLFKYSDGDFFAYHALDIRTEPGRFSMHAHRDPEIYCFLGGKGQYRVEGTVYPLQAGDVLIMRTAETHMPEIVANTPYERFVFNFRPEYLDRLDPSGTLWRMFFDRPLGKGNLYRPSCLADDSYLRTFDDMDSHSLPMRTILLSRLLTLLSQCAETYASGIETKGAPTGRLTQIVRYLNDHLTEELTLNDIAERFYLSRSQLCRIFREGTGSGVMEYIRIKRLMAAKEQIASGIPAGRAAIACGFSDYSSFYRAYKDRFGVSPTKKS